MAWHWKMNFDYGMALEDELGVLIQDIVYGF